MKVAFLDRDGTIISDYPDSQWKRKTEPEFLPGALRGIQRLVDLGFAPVVITNQYLIGENFISLHQYNSFAHLFTEQLKKKGIELLDTFYCPHRRDENCNCMKPNEGMIQQALKKYPQIDLSRSVLAGDSVCDKLLADRLGIRFFGIAGGTIEDQFDCYKSLNAVAEILSTEQRLLLL